MHPSRTSVGLVGYSSTSDVAVTYRTCVLGSRGLGSDVCRPPSGGAGVAFGPIVVVAVL